MNLTRTYGLVVNWVVPTSDCYKGKSEVVITFYFMQITTRCHPVVSVYGLDVLIVPYQNFFVIPSGHGFDTLGMHLVAADLLRRRQVEDFDGAVVQADDQDALQCPSGLILKNNF